MRAREVTTSPSRRSRKELTGCGLWFLRAFIFPHTLVGLFLIWQALVTTAWMVAGDDTVAKVTEAWSEPGKKSPSYEIKFVYKDGPVEFSETSSVSKEIYDQIPESIKRPHPASNSATADETYSITVRLLSLGAIRHVAIVPPVGNSPAGQWVGAVFVALFWNGILSVFLYQAWVKPLRMRREAQRGFVRIPML